MQQKAENFSPFFRRCRAEFETDNSLADARRMLTPTSLMVAIPTTGTPVNSTREINYGHRRRMPTRNRRHWGEKRPEAMDYRPEVRNCVAATVVRTINASLSSPASHTRK